MHRLLTAALVLVLLAPAVPAQDAEPVPKQPAPAKQKPAPAQREDAPALLFLRVNEQGAEEWYRVKDGAVVVRVARGAYQQRPYEGMGISADPEPVEVESFFVDKFEVTNARFVRFLNSREDAARLIDGNVPGIERHENAWRATPGRERHPVTAATGGGAVEFAKWAGAALPTRVQWEKAAGGPEGRVYPWGDELPDLTRANFGSPAPRGAEAVGSHPAGASPYGCHDMAGNVYERVAMPGRRTRDGEPMPVMIKGGSWVSPHPLNLRVLDLCVQPMGVAERSVGLRCVMADPEPERASRTTSVPPRLKLATDFDAAVAEAKRRHVPVFLSLLFDTCGQCDRTRAQCYTDPRFVAYCNANMVVVMGHDPGDAMDEPHATGESGACPLYPGLTCEQHERMYTRGLGVVGTFTVSPGNFVLHPDKAAKGAGAAALLAGERDLPKWGNAVETYLEVFERCREALRQ